MTVTGTVLTLHLPTTTEPQDPVDLVLLRYADALQALREGNREAWAEHHCAAGEIARAEFEKAVGARG